MADGGDSPTPGEFDEVLRRLEADMREYERRAAWRLRIAWWSLIPYGLAAMLSGWAMGQVFEAGMFRVGVVLVVGYTGLVLTQWIMPLLMRRGERR